MVMLFSFRVSKMYWSDNSRNMISQADFDGGNVQMLTQIDQDSVGKFSLLRVRKKVFSS